MHNSVVKVRIEFQFTKVPTFWNIWNFWWFSNFQLQLNVLCASAAALRTHCEMRGGKIDNQQFQKSIMGLVIGGLGSQIGTIRYFFVEILIFEICLEVVWKKNFYFRAAATETLARLAQAVGDPQVKILKWTLQTVLDVFQTTIWFLTYFFLQSIIKLVVDNL